MGNISISPISQRQDVNPLNSLNCFEPSKPLIPRLLQLHQSLDKIGNQASHHFIDRLEHENQELKIWSKQHLDHLQASANSSLFEKGWTYFESIANIVIGVFNVVAGASVIIKGNGNLAGSALIAAGVFSILHLISTHVGIGDWLNKMLAEKNQSLKDQFKLILPFVLFVLKAGVSLLSYEGYMTLVNHKNLLNILQQLQSYISMSTQAGNSYLSLRKTWSESKLTEIQGELKFHEQSADLLSRLIEYSMQEVKRIKLCIKKPINSLMQATTLAAQKV